MATADYRLDTFGAAWETFWKAREQLKQFPPNPEVVAACARADAAVESLCKQVLESARLDGMAQV
jgi:hypothetical protein